MNRSSHAGSVELLGEKRTPAFKISLARRSSVFLLAELAQLGELVGGEPWAKTLVGLGPRDHLLSVSDGMPSCSATPATAPRSFNSRTIRDGSVTKVRRIPPGLKHDALLSTRSSLYQTQDGSNCFDCLDAFLQQYGVTSRDLLQMRELCIRIIKLVP